MVLGRNVTFLVLFKHGEVQHPRERQLVPIILSRRRSGLSFPCFSMASAYVSRGNGACEIFFSGKSVLTNSMNICLGVLQHILLRHKRHLKSSCVNSG